MLNKALIAILVVALFVSVFAAKGITASEEDAFRAAAPPVEWQREFTGGEGYSVFQLPDGGYVVLTTKDGSLWLTKLKSPETNPFSLPEVQAAIAITIVAVLASVGFGLLKRRNKRQK